MSEPVITTTPATAAFDRACVRLRALQPDYPRVYAPAAMCEQGKRRWWQLRTGLREGRLDLMYRRHAAEMVSDEVAAEVVGTALVHAVAGRVTALFVATGQAWDPGPDNIWIHHDNDGGIDWAGLSDITLRSAGVHPGMVALPGEHAVAVWLANRCAASLELVGLHLTRSTGLAPRRFWSLLGESVCGAATYVPALNGMDEALGAHRGQLIMSALEERGLPVRRGYVNR
ncbi:hypothetical protein ACWEVD_05760 [Nocardia thailandica]|uniref:Uncharacterized protein n=1 Tax=Nocardia thailandica TaxID=257275 RepID=A0ABW6PN67_9NOCA